MEKVRQLVTIGEMLECLVDEWGEDRGVGYWQSYQAWTLVRNAEMEVRQREEEEKALEAERQEGKGKGGGGIRLQDVDWTRFKERPGVEPRREVEGR